MTRALTAVVCQRALFETIHSRPKPELESGWAKLREIIDYLITLLPGRAHVHSTVADQLGAGYSPYIKVRFEPLNGHQLCVIDVERSSEPAYLKGQHGQNFGYAWQVLAADWTLRRRCATYRQTGECQKQDTSDGGGFSQRNPINRNCLVFWRLNCVRS